MPKAGAVTIETRKPFGPLPGIFSSTRWRSREVAWEKLWGVTLADLPGYNILQDRQLVERGAGLPEPLQDRLRPRVGVQLTAVDALDDISIHVAEGECVALVGESSRPGRPSMSVIV